MARYFIGDIQGCYSELNKLLQSVDFNPNKDVLYPVGDLIARGADSLKVAELMLSLGNAVKPVLGNHDLHLMAVYAGLRNAKKSDKLSPLLNAPIIDDYINWLRQQPLVRAFDDLVITHAGWYPGWDKTILLAQSKLVSDKLKSANYLDWLAKMYGSEPDYWSPLHNDEQAFRFTVNACTRMRYITSELSLEFNAKMPVSDAPDNLQPWFNAQTKEMKQHRIIFGHWASLLGVTGQDNLQALDTGCVWGNTMTAYRMEDQAIFSVLADS